MRNPLTQVLSIAILITSPLAFPKHACAAEVILDKVIAIVDQDVIMQTELNERLQAVYQNIKQSGSATPPESEIIPQIIDQLIKERLQLEMATRYGIRVSDEQVNQAMRNMAQAQGLSFDSFVEQAHKMGLDIDTMRQQLSQEMIIRQLQNGAVKSQIRISDQEIDSFLKSEQGQFWKSPELQLGHIMLTLSAGAPKQQVADVKARAEDLYQQLKNGADFRELATINSAGQNALKGGDIGWRRAVKLPGILSNAIKGLPTGGVSKPVRSDAGYHIVKVYQSRGGLKATVVQQHKARHILLKTNELRNDEACYQQLMTLRERSQNGEEFAALAKEHSEDYGSALGGGDLGWSMPGQFVPEFEHILETVEIDEISYPFQSQFGWHIMVVDERREQDFSGQVLRNQATEILRDRKFDEELLIWLQELNDKAYIEIKG